MRIPRLTSQRSFSSREERFHAISHGVGAVGALVGGILLTLSAAQAGGLLAVVGVTVFSLAAVLLYSCSALLHALPDGRIKDRFELLDHLAIYLLIAGTYTPFTLGILRGPWGWTLLTLIWILAVVGMLMKIFGGLRKTVPSTLLYVAMGWLILIAARPMIQRMPTPGLLLVLAGGLSYSIGVIFFIARRLPFGHFIWHLWVMAGTSFHYFAIRDYSA